MTCKCLFLSTLSLRRATSIVFVMWMMFLSFLSTLSLRRATKLKTPCVKLSIISIHALLAESDLSMHTSLCCGCFDFYPRSPCGERHLRVVDGSKSSIISIHALLAESDRLCTILYSCPGNFYPRSPCGERRLPTALRTPHQRFLSTLSLRRATAKARIPTGTAKISIHALLAESDACTGN